LAEAGTSNGVFKSRRGSAVDPCCGQDGYLAMV
jgi:hypothetical protein